MNSYKEIFIETSTLVDFTFKKEYRDKISAILDEYSVKSSSNYVRMELLRGVIGYLVYLHNKIFTCPQWSDAMRAVSRLSATPQRHRLGTVLEALQQFWTEVEAKTPKEIQRESGEMSLSDYLREKCSSFLRVSIRRLWRQYEKIIDKKLNPMDCFIDIQPPMREGDMLAIPARTCEKSTFECKIRQFFIENQKSFDSVRDHLRDLPEENVDNELKRHRQSLKEILRLLPYRNRKISNKEPKMKKCCWNCGDSILAVVTPEDATILHHNPRHYNPICTAVKQQSITY
ncbi:hypothetical protein IH992_15140 [Candidatus Poribacteria bacterium]|nr:hypothetical protein [Candidatus Poribacteria bacterium]